MPRLNGKVPKFRRHKRSGQGVVTLDGKDFYCGPYDNPESRTQYDRLVAEWLANGRRLHPSERDEETDPVTVGELAAAFWEHARRYYRHPDGRPTSHVETVRQVLRLVLEHYVDTPVEEFGPLALKAVRLKMIDAGWCRTHVNRQVGKVKMMFRWGTEEELVPGPVYQALRAVAGLRRGRTAAPESEPVRPVPDQFVDAVEPHVSRQVWAMIQLQRLTAARPGEVVIMRAVDIDTTGEIWIYTPMRHKTAHHGHARTIFLGPQAQEIVRPFLTGRAIDAFLFSPVEAEAERRREQHRQRSTPAGSGNRPGSNRTARPKRKPGELYDVAAYRRAITRACDLAFLPPPDLQRQRVAGRKGERWEIDAEWRDRLEPEAWEELLTWRREHRWHPHQLRHNGATYIRKRFGPEAARAVLGHRTLAIVDTYAELDAGLAAQVMREIG